MVFGKFSGCFCRSTICSITKSVCQIQRLFPGRFHNFCTAAGLPQFQGWCTYLLKIFDNRARHWSWPRSQTDKKKGSLLHTRKFKSWGSCQMFMVSFCCLVRSLNILHIRCDLGSIQVFLQSRITCCSGHYLSHLTLEKLRCVESRKAFIWEHEVCCWDKQRWKMSTVCSKPCSNSCSQEQEL